MRTVPHIKNKWVYHYEVEYSYRPTLDDPFTYETYWDKGIVLAKSVDEVYRYLKTYFLNKDDEFSVLRVWEGEDPASMVISLDSGGGLLKKKN